MKTLETILSDTATKRLRADPDWKGWTHTEREQFAVALDEKGEHSAARFYRWTLTK